MEVFSIIHPGWLSGLIRNPVSTSFKVYVSMQTSKSHST